MSGGQHKRPIGSGMKPRGFKAVTQKKEKRTMQEQPIVEGQQGVVLRPVLEVGGGNKTPDRIEAEKFQNLESKAADPEPMVADEKSLEAALSESGEPSFDDMQRSIEDGTVKVIDAEFEEVSEIQAPCGGVPMGNRLGPQADGSHRIAITIQEGYWEAVQQWAEADGVPVEQWVTDRLYEYCSTYGAAPRGR